jgi:hypothetical protein
VPYQAAAVVLALLGIVLGKYLGFVWVISDTFEELGIGDVDVSVFSRATWDAFIEARNEVWSAFDALWIGLAVVTAFRIPAVPRPPAEEPAEPVP